MFEMFKSELEDKDKKKFNIDELHAYYEKELEKLKIVSTEELASIFTAIMNVMFARTVDAGHPNPGGILTMLCDQTIEKLCEIYDARNERERKEKEGRTKEKTPSSTEN